MAGAIGNLIDAMLRGLGDALQILRETFHGCLFRLGRSPLIQVNE